MARDVDNQDIEVGDTVVTAIREGNVANLRVGEVLAFGYDVEPNVERTPDTPMVNTVVVRWFLTTGDFLPKRPTKVSAERVYRV